DAPVLQFGTAHIREIVSTGGEILACRALELDGLTEPGVVRSHYGGGYMKARAEHVFVRGAPPPAFERRDGASPLTDAMLRPFTTPAGLVQFDRRLTDADFKRLGEFMAESPTIGLRAYGSYDGSITDLEFLRFLPKLRSFSADALFQSLESLD